jgi:hypothetical protein
VVFDAEDGHRVVVNDDEQYYFLNIAVLGHDMLDTHPVYNATAGFSANTPSRERQESHRPSGGL